MVENSYSLFLSDVVIIAHVTILGELQTHVLFP